LNVVINKGSHSNSFETNERAEATKEIIINRQPIIKSFNAHFHHPRARPSFDFKETKKSIGIVQSHCLIKRGKSARKRLLIDRTRNASRFQFIDSKAPTATTRTDNSKDLQEA